MLDFGQIDCMADRTNARSLGLGVNICTEQIGVRYKPAADAIEEYKFE